MKIRSILFALGAQDIALYNQSLLNENAVCVQLASSRTDQAVSTRSIALVGEAGFSNVVKTHRNGLLLVVVNTQIPKRLAHPSPNVIVCTSRYSFYEVQRRFLMLIKNEAMLETSKSRMFDIFRQTYNIQQFVHGVFPILGNPIIVADTDERILATAGDFEANRDDFSPQIANGYTLEENIAQMREDRLVEKAREIQGPYISKNPRKDSEIEWVTSIIRYKDLELGRFDVMGSDHPFTAYDLELIDYAGALAGIIVDRNDHVTSYANQGASILNDLIDRKFTDSKSAEKLLSEAGFDATGVYAAGVVSGSESFITPGFNAHLGRLVSKAVPHCAWITRNGIVVVLIPLDKEESEGFPYYRQLEQRIASNNELRETIERNSLTAVFGDPFENILRCADSYRMALGLAEGRHLSTTVHFTWHHKSEIIAIQFAKTNDVNALLDKRILAMKRHDETHHTAYLDTLREYLQGMGNVKHASEKLNIHRNTYFYRLNKMKELFDLDPYSGHDNLDAAFTLSIIDSGLPLFD
ncbi:MAG: helix-turn-helix domain-containing protein [Eggerthellaceae bacterium]|jgi:hypothetical protein|nr:helix-turn-helix domain-containing protein [Eggerthellaceae bacterium]